MVYHAIQNVVICGLQCFLRPIRSFLVCRQQCRVADWQDLVIVTAMVLTILLIQRYKTLMDLTMS